MVEGYYVAGNIVELVNCALLPLLAQVLRALSQHSRLQGTQLVAFEHFCVHDTWSDLKGLSEKQWSDVRRVNTHTYTSKHFFKRPLKALLLWQVRGVLPPEWYWFTFSMLSVDFLFLQ